MDTALSLWPYKSCYWWKLIQNILIWIRYPMFHKTPPRETFFKELGKQIDLRFPMVMSERRSVHHFSINPIRHCEQEEEHKQQQRGWKKKKIWEIQKNAILVFHWGFHWVIILKSICSIHSDISSVNVSPRASKIAISIHFIVHFTTIFFFQKSN